MKPIRPNLDIYEGGFGKIPPQATQMEEAVLGAVLLEKKAIQVVLDILSPESFYKESHCHIYAAILSLHTENEPIDILTVVERLRKMGNLEICGGPMYVSGLTSRVASTAHLESHARVIAQKHIAREMIRVCQETVSKFYEETTDVFDELATHHASINDIGQKTIKSDALPISEITGDIAKEVDQRATTPDFCSGVLSGINAVDKIIAGFGNTDLIYIAARPSMGKTALVASMALKMALRGIPVAFFSLEMSKKQLVYRMLSQRTGLQYDALTTGYVGNDDVVIINDTISRLHDYPLHIDDTAGINIAELKRRARSMVKDHGIKVFFVDYLQLISTDRKPSRDREVAEISAGLKNMAKDLGVPVVVLSQLSRAVEQRDDKRPKLSDLRDSGTLEQDADIVMFLYRPGPYVKVKYENNNQETEEYQRLKHKAELLVSKHRNGKTGVVYLYWNPEATTFHEEA